MLRSGTPERAGAEVAGAVLIESCGFVLAQAFVPDSLVECRAGSLHGGVGVAVSSLAVGRLTVAFEDR